MSGVQGTVATLSLSADRDFVLRSARIILLIGAFMVPLTAVRTVAGFPISDILVVLALAFSLLSFAPHIPDARVPRVLLIASGLAVVATGLLALASEDPTAELMVGLRLVFVWAVWGLAVTRLAWTSQHLVALAGAFVAGCVLSATVAVLQFLGLDLRPLFLADLAVDSVRFIGLNGHPNGQGGALAIALTLCVAALIHGRRRPTAAVSAIILTFGLLLSASITAMISAIIGFVMVLLLARRARMLVVGLAVAVLAFVLYEVLVFVFPGLVTPVDRIPSATGVTGISTVDIRWRTVEFALAAIAREPFLGAGFADGGGTFNGETAVHNMVLLAWYQGGALLAAAVTCVIIAALICVVRIIRGPLTEALAAATVASLFFALTGPSLYDRYAWVPVVLLLCAARIMRPVNGDNETWPRSPR